VIYKASKINIPIFFLVGCFNNELFQKKIYIINNFFGVVVNGSTKTWGLKEPGVMILYP
jgi:hypothetical protein